MPDTEAILAANTELAGAVKELSGKVDQIGVRAKTAVILAAVLALVVVGVIVNSVHVSRTENRTNRLQEYQVANCESSNEARKAQRDLWGFILEISAANPKQTQTAEERKNLVKFQAYVTTTFADRDCSKVAEGKVK